MMDHLVVPKEGTILKLIGLEGVQTLWDKQFYGFFNTLISVWGGEGGGNQVWCKCILVIKFGL